ncbi:MAG: serine hydrolase domain-containing protein [Candidatus Binatia bacterium]
MSRTVSQIVWKFGLTAGVLFVGVVAVWMWRFAVIERVLTLLRQDTQIQNFRRMQEVFPSRIIPKSSVPVRFERSVVDLDVTYQYRGKVSRLDEFLQRTTTLGLLVLQDDRIVYERYFFGATEDSRFTSWSVAKSFVSALVGIAIDERRIAGVDEPIVKYVPELEHSGYARASIKDVLQMSSGVEFNEDYDNALSDISRMYLMSFLFGSRINAYPAAVGSKRAPGEAFDYVSVNTQSLGMLLSHVTGKSLATYLEEKLWSPLGMEEDAYWITDRTGADAMEYAFCCLNVTLRDYAKFGRLFLRGGDWNGTQIISQSWVSQSVVPDKAYLRLTGADRPEWAGPDWDIGYQYQWWVPAGDDGEFTGIGVWGQYLYVNPRAHVIIVKASVDPDFDRDMETIAAFRAITAGLEARRR